MKKSFDRRTWQREENRQVNDYQRRLKMTNENLRLADGDSQKLTKIADQPKYQQ